MRRPGGRNSWKRSRGTARAAAISGSREAVRYVKPISQAALPHRLGGGTVLSEPGLSDRFKAALLELKAEPHSAIRKESTLEILRSVVEGHRANRVVVANLPVEVRAVVLGALQGRSVQFLEDLPSTEVLPACAAAEVGVTWAEFAIAE